MQMRIGRPGDKEKREFKEPDRDCYPFNAPVGAGQRDGEQRRGGDRQGQDARQPVKLADRGDACKFGH